MSATIVNTEQYDKWNGESGQRWATEQKDIYQVGLLGHGKEAIRQAMFKEGEVVLDIGCGIGETSMEIAKLVGNTGKVYGVDISIPQLDVAKRLSKERGINNVEFLKADMQVFSNLPEKIDIMYSRFGIMFFEDNMAAFSNIRNNLKDGGRMSFVCWRGVPLNPIFRTSEDAAKAVLGIMSTYETPQGPGPMAFADPTKLRNILNKIGFTNIKFDPKTIPFNLGNRTQAECVKWSNRRAGKYMQECIDQGLLKKAEAKLGQMFDNARQPNGEVHMPANVWVVTATVPGNNNKL